MFNGKNEVCQLSTSWIRIDVGTRVVAYVQGSMVKPQPERPFEGTITIHSEISPMASSEYEQGRPSEEEVTITRMLDKIIRRSDAIDKESLCILAGRRVRASPSLSCSSHYPPRPGMVTPPNDTRSLRLRQPP